MKWICPTCGWVVEDTNVRNKPSVCGTCSDFPDKKDPLTIEFIPLSAILPCTVPQNSEVHDQIKIDC